jgi:hypothetical protein
MLEESNFKPEYVIKGIWELIELIK